MCGLGGYGRPGCGKLEMKIGNFQYAGRAGEKKEQCWNSRWYGGIIGLSCGAAGGT